jgi:hypothetical protein
MTTYQRALGTEIYVAPTGDDTYPNQDGYKTIAAALTAASAGDIVRIEGAHTEDLTVPANVTLNGPNARLTGTLTLNDGSAVALERHSVVTATTGLALSGADAVAHYDTNRTDCAGTGNLVNVTTATARLHLSSRLMSCVTGRLAAATTIGTVQLQVGRVEVAGATTALSASGSGSLLGTIESLVEIGAGVGTGTGIELSDTASAYLVINQATITNLHDTASSAILRIVSNNLSGTEVGPSILVGEGDPRVGFENLTDTTMGFVDGSRTFTLTDAGSGYKVAVAGVVNAFSGNDTVVIADTQGIWYIYYDSTFTLTASQTPWTIGTVAPVATFYWDVTASDSYGTLSEERHLWLMDSAMHQSLHESVGTRLASGLDLTFTPGSGAANADAQVAITSGVIYDEDLEINIVDDATPTANYEQPLSLPAEIPVWYRHGVDASNRWVALTATDYPFRYTTQGRYNWNNTGTWQQASVTDGNFFNAWICYAPRYTDPVFAIQGQTDHATLTSALTETLSDMTLTGLPMVEVVYAYRITYETDTGYANTPNSRIVEAVMIPGNAGGGSPPRGVDHNAMLNRAMTSAHPADSVEVDASGFSGNLSATDIEVQTALDTIDAMSSGGGDTVRHILDLSGTWNFKVDGAVDPTSGLTAAKDYASFTTMSIAAGKLDIEVTTSSSNLRGYLYLELTDLPDLRFSQNIDIWVRYSVSAIAGGAGNARMFGVYVAGDEDMGDITYTVSKMTPDEYLSAETWWASGTQKLRPFASFSNGATADRTGYNDLSNLSNVHFLHTASDTNHVHFESYDETTGTRLYQVQTPARWHTIASAGGKAYLVLQWYPLTGSPEDSITMSVHDVQVTMT